MPLQRAAVYVGVPTMERLLSLEGLKNYRAVTRRYRNRRIGEFLKELHLTEGRNTGFLKILKSLESNGSPKPLFETDEDRLYFLTTLYLHPDFNRASVEKNAITVSSDTQNDTQNDTLQPELSEKGKRVLAEIGKNPDITGKELSEKLNISLSTIRRIIRILKRDAYIVREGSDKSGYWRIV